MKGEAPSRPASLAARMAMLLVQIYRHTLSALLGRQCRYLPSCSEYALDALRLHGFWIGSIMAVARISRCGPFGGHGYDPVMQAPPAAARWWCPWRYGVWRMPREDDKLAVPKQPE
jgi:putative membrane protein insertion efficiency factor